MKYKLKYPRITPSESEIGNYLFGEFVRGWAKMSRQDRDVGQPTNSEIWSHAWREAIAFERERAEIAGKTLHAHVEPNEPS